MLTLSGGLGIDEIARIVTELDAVCQMGCGTVAVIFADDAQISPAGVAALRQATHGHAAQADRLRLFGGTETTIRALVEAGLAHYGVWSDHETTARRVHSRATVEAATHPTRPEFDGPR